MAPSDYGTINVFVADWLGDGIDSSVRIASAEDMADFDFNAVGQSEQ